jgi:hypothetical protein
MVQIFVVSFYNSLLFSFVLLFLYQNTILRNFILKCFKSEKSSLIKCRNTIMAEMCWTKAEHVFMSLGSMRGFEVSLYTVLISTVGKGQYFMCRSFYLCWKRALYPLNVTLWWPQGGSSCSSQVRSSQLRLDSKLSYRAGLILEVYL